MTVVNPKSISGINSITTGSGSDNLLTIHTNDGTERVRVDSTGTTKIVTGIVTTLTATTGIVTTFEATTGDITTLRAPTGIVTSFTTNTLTANSTAKVGSGVTLSPDGDVFVTGVSTCLGTSLSNSVIVGSAVTISSDGIDAVGAAITCANINGTQVGGRRNFFINGAVQVAQRGTSHTGSAVYGLDRWWQVHGGSATVTQDSTVPSGEGFGYSMKLSNVSGDVSIGQPIELVAAGKQSGFPAGKRITFSFYGKLDSGTDGISIYAMFRQGKYSSTNQVNFTGTGAAITLTTTWTRHVVTMTIPTCHSGSTMVAFEMGGISGTTYLTGFQAEIGEVATAFEHRSVGEELVLCQRYYQALSLHGLAASKVPYDSTFRVYVPFKQTMRAIPTIAYPSISNFQPGGATGTASGANATVDGVLVTTGSNEGNSNYIPNWVNDTSAIMKASAEL